MKVSIVIPIYNEEENIKPLIEEIFSVNPNYEIICIDDGSTDNTYNELLKFKDKIKIIKFRRNYGQTAAMSAGFKQSTGDLICPIDADLQTDSKDIPKLLSKLNEGYDCVCGWRKNRKDNISKQVISRLANILRKLFLDDGVKDSGCTLRVFKRECVQNLDLRGEHHRFLSFLIKNQGYTLTEIEVNHRERQFGKTKYSMKRVFNGMADMLFLWFWSRYKHTPGHLFMKVASLTLLISFIGVVEQIVKSVFFIGRLYLGPVLILSMLFFMISCLLIMVGFLSEILVRTYHHNTPPYEIEKPKVI